VQAPLRSHKPPPIRLDSLSVLFELAAGISGTLRSTPTYLQLLAFGRNASAEALGRNELVLRKRGGEPQRFSFPPVVRSALTLRPSPPQSHAAPLSDFDKGMLDTVVAFEAIADAIKSDGRAREV